MRLLKSILIPLLLLGIFVLIIGCQRRESNIFYSSITEEYLPNRAVIVERLGNDWIIFELDGKKFLFREYMIGNKGFSALTQIIEEKK